MKRFTSFAIVMTVALAMSVGCADKTTTKTKQTIEGPGGTTEIEHKETVKQTGENPPGP